MTHAFDQVWPAFALVTGLLLVGAVAERDGVFAWTGGMLARVPGPGQLRYAVALLTVVLVTAVLNLDTSVLFLTPVLLHLARHRSIDEEPFLYGVVFMSNAASLLLPGANLTNLIVLHGEHVSGTTFFIRLWPAAIVAPVVTAIVLLAWFRRELADPGSVEGAPPRPRIGIGLAATVAATVLVLALGEPALPVLAVGVIAVLASGIGRGRVLEVVDAKTIAVLFVLAVGLGAIGRAWHGPASLLAASGRAGTAVVGATAAVLVNNLPASVLLTPTPPAHPRALLLGLDLGPNLAVTGSLSAFLWWRVARSLDARPSIVGYSLLGIVIVPLSLGAALSALELLAPGRL